jgi:excisionase family DNA binding protein
MADAVAARIGTAGASSKRLMAIPEAAEYLGRTQDAVRKLITRGVLPVTKLDGKRQVDRAALDKLISESTHFEA